MVIVRLVSLPPRTRLVAGTSVGLLEAAQSVKLAAGVSGSANVKPIGPATVFPAFVRSEMTESIGASLTGRMVRTNDVLALPPSVSVAMMVMVAEPVWLVAGMSVTVGTPPPLPKRMRFVGMSVGLDDSAQNTIRSEERRVGKECR